MPTQDFTSLRHYFIYSDIIKIIKLCSSLLLVIQDFLNFIGAGIGIGLIFAALLAGVARNPPQKEELFRYAILGFALTEAIALFSLMIGFLVLFA